MDLLSHCVHGNCAESAQAVLVYDYEKREVILDNAFDDAPASAWGLCAAHADALRVPRGWICNDRRGPALALFAAEAV